MNCVKNEIPKKDKQSKNNCGDGYDIDCKEPQRNFWEEMCNKCVNLVTNLKKSQPSQRIRELAIPKYRRMKYRPAVVKPYEKKIEIIRGQKHLSTRAEQLSYAPVRKLIANRNAARGIVSPIVYERFNKYIHRGMYSMYSRLANSAPPIIVNPIKPWTEEQWSKHSEHLTIISKPKKIPQPPPLVRKIKPIAELKNRIEVLAQSKFKPIKELKKLVVKSSALKYVPSERINELSQPKPVRELPPRKLRRFRGKKYEASDRTKELSKHREKKTAVSDTKENPFQVSPNALKARTTERMKTLAIPMERDNPEPKDLTKVSKAALKAIASKRLIELAQPKKLRPQAKE